MRYGDGALYDSAGSMQAKVSSVLHNGIWIWPPARYEDLAEIQSSCMKLHSTVKIQLFGFLPKLVNLHVQKHGRRSEENCLKLIGES